MRIDGPRVVLQAPVGEALGWLSLESPVEILQAWTLDDVVPILKRAEAAAAAGRIAAGFVSYEAAPAFDPALTVRVPGSLPLAWFGVFEHSKVMDPQPSAERSIPPLDWQPSMTQEEYEEGIEAIRRYIACGDTYQVNFTLRLTSIFTADPWELFTAMSRGQDSRCCAYVDTGDRVLCSASPELFFRLAGERIWSRPMKGTAARGRTLEEDRLQAQWLQSSSKNQAENVMIVDMVRNDLGRIATPETVWVKNLWHLEKYPTLFQLTSTVEARTQASLVDIFAALFPCASVTGAPKIRSMEIISELEPQPRGAYTGAIGLIGPGRQARFNVGIRTVDIDPVEGRAVYGTGSGVVWESVADEEWRECRTKTRVLEPPPAEFELLETMLWDPNSGFDLLERHLQRLAESAAYFDFLYHPEQVREALAQCTENLPRLAHRARLLMSRRGTVRIEIAPLVHSTRPWRLAVATEPVSSDDPFLFHKTTHRQVYDHHRGRFPDHDDVLLWNERGEITESTLANVVIRRRQGRVTPSQDCGLLAGTFRAELLAKGEIEEGILRLQDLHATDEIYLVNSVRRWIPTELDLTTLTAAAETHRCETA